MQENVDKLRNVFTDGFGELVLKSVKIGDFKFSEKANETAGKDLVLSEYDDATGGTETNIQRTITSTGRLHLKEEIITNDLESKL